MLGKCNQNREQRGSKFFPSRTRVTTGRLCPMPNASPSLLALVWTPDITLHNAVGSVVLGVQTQTMSPKFSLSDENPTAPPSPPRPNFYQLCFHVVQPALDIPTSRKLISCQKLKTKDQPVFIKSSKLRSVSTALQDWLEHVFGARPTWAEP